MEILRNPKSAEVYALFVKELFAFGSIFLIAAILCFIYGFKNIQKKTEAEIMRTTWQDAHRGTVAVRFLLFQGGQEKLWYPCNVQILKTNDTAFNISKSIISRDSEIYLIPASYNVIVTTNGFKAETIPLNFSQDMIGLRKSFSVSLEPLPKQ